MPKSDRLFSDLAMPLAHLDFIEIKATTYSNQKQFDYIKQINPDICDEDLKDAFVGRLKNSQPICEPGFLKKIPSIQTPHKQLQVADTCYYYPEDRGISESIRLGRLMAKNAINA